MSLYEQHQADYIKHLEEGLESSLALNKAQAEKISNMEIWEKKYLDRIEELENQLDKCSHHEAMAHQGGYEIGKASQIKELSDGEKKQITKEYLHRHLLYVVTEEAVDDHKLHDVVVSDFDFARVILKKASEK